MLVSKYFLEDIVNSISFYDLDECEKVFFQLDPNDENEIKYIIKYNLFIYFLLKNKEYQEAFKSSLSYYLTTESVDFEACFDNGMPSVDTPEDSKLFYTWIWEVFFENETYVIENHDLDNYIEKNECNWFEEINKKR